MYVVCHKCEAAYVVEDSLVVGAAARAQCPNCLHVQPVGAGAASSAAPRPGGIPSPPLRPPLPRRLSSTTPRPPPPSRGGKRSRFVGTAVRRSPIRLIARLES